VHIAKHCGYGNGNVHVVVDQACVQAQARAELIFVSGGGTFVPMLEQHGVRHVMLRQDQRSPLTLARTAIGLTRLCRRLRPDIVHAHMMGGAVIGYLASRAIGVPLVTTMHNSFDPHAIIMRLGDRVVAVSHAERDHLIARGYHPDCVDVVWNAHSSSPRETFMRNPHPIVLKGPGVVAICALHRRKGVFDLIQACASVFPDFPEWRLYIAGEGPDAQSLQALAAGSGLGERVTFLGFVPSPGTIYRQADIFVLASYADPGSLSIGEARTAGCAIVATAVGGTTEMLEHGGAGCLVMPGTPEQLAGELRRLMADPAAREALRAAALRGSEIFDVGRLVGDYDAAYGEAMRRRGIQSRRVAPALADG
jgi:glycosyltransferase involved in cell wall biosynthesis